MQWYGRCSLRINSSTRLLGESARLLGNLFCEGYGRYAFLGTTPPSFCDYNYDSIEIRGKSMKSFKIYNMFDHVSSLLWTSSDKYDLPFGWLLDLTNWLLLSWRVSMWTYESIHNITHETRDNYIIALHFLSFYQWFCLNRISVMSTLLQLLFSSNESTKVTNGRAMVECRGGPTVYAGTHPRGWTWKWEDSTVAKHTPEHTPQHIPKQTLHFCLPTWAAKHTPKQTCETYPWEKLPGAETSFKEATMYKESRQAATYQFHPISFFPIAWCRLSKIAPDALLCGIKWTEKGVWSGAAANTTCSHLNHFQWWKQFGWPAMVAVDLHGGGPM